ncbi:15279_t:CDS:2, partial [Acaulospora morrowiae]
MRSIFIFTFICLICYILPGSAVPLNERDDEVTPSLVQTDFFKAFQPLPETPTNVVRSYTFELKKVPLAIDGVSRLVWAVNGQYPGPMIRANKGDTFNITVINKFGDPATIHWHGLDQKGSNWYDGVPGITQCPIPNGVTFSYVFNLTQSGTYWYHSHFIAQYVDGLKGPIVIYDQDDPYKKDYDYEYVLEVSDWYHKPTGDFLPEFRSPTYFAADPFPDSGEITGVGQWNCTIPTCKPTKFATYKVTKGKKYRFRIINTSAMAHFTISIDNHPLKIIEVEGTIVEPVTVEVLSVNIAQRYSVIVDANQPIENYWIRATLSNCSLPGQFPLTINYNETKIFQNMNITGILKYEGAPDTLPTSQAYPANESDCTDQDPTTLKPKSLSPSVPTGNATRIPLLIEIVGVPQLEATINNSSIVLDFSYPSNKKVIDGAGFITSDNAYAYDNPGGAIEILLMNTEGRTHPFHLHGHSFWVVAEGIFNQSLDTLKYNFDNPIYRDTVTVKPFGLTAIRYYADNPGVWLIHCHIEWHVEMGMVAQLIENPSVFNKSSIPEAVLGLCEAFDNG